MHDSSIVALGCAAFLLLGGICLAVGLRVIAQARASRNWKRVQGRILKSWASRQSAASAEGPEGSTANIEYEYEVDGRAFRGNRIRFGAQSIGNGSTALVQRYPAGTAVAVLYDPARPARWTLEQGVWQASVVACILGGQSIVGGSILVFVISLSFA